MLAQAENAAEIVTQILWKSTAEAVAQTCGPNGARIIVVDPDRRLVRASDAGFLMLRQETTLRMSMDRVRATIHQDDARLGRAIAHAAQNAFEQVVPLASRGSGLTASVIALRGASDGLEVLLMIRDAREERRRALARAASIFGFTGAETRLLAALFDGCSVPDAARRLGVARTTARSHLQNVFAKTGVNRQGDLMTLLAG